MRVKNASRITLWEAHPMFSFRSLARTMLVAAAILAARPGFGAPALTTIQDVLYRADGTRFSGTLYITWTNFQSGDNTIPSQGITIPVVNGAIRAQLTPTTTASAGANYTVQYSSQGKYQFSEVWAVPPTTFTLKVRDVRVSSGSQVGPPPPVLSQILISDVTGLATELATRPASGINYQPGRTAVINTSGQIDAATGNLSDCIHVDGTSGPCGSGSSGSGGSASFVDAETPAGIADGTNTAFTLLAAPSPSSSLALYRNGLLMRSSLDFTLDTNHITFIPAAAPQPGDVLVASYRLAAAGAIAESIQSFPAPEVICSGTGAQTVSGTPLVSVCNIPASHIAAGDRFEVSYDFAHTGAITGFTTAVTWGNSPVASMSGSNADTLLGGRTSVGVGSMGSQWNTQQWTGNSPLSVSAGTAMDSLDSGITLRFTASPILNCADTVTLRNFTVVRFPAVTMQ